MNKLTHCHRKSSGVIGDKNGSDDKRVTSIERDHPLTSWECYGYPKQSLINHRLVTLYVWISSLSSLHVFYIFTTVTSTSVNTLITFKVPKVAENNEK